MLLALVESRAWRRGKGLAILSVLLELLAVYLLTQQDEMTGVSLLVLGLGCLVVAVLSSHSHPVRQQALAAER